MKATLRLRAEMAELERLSEWVDAQVAAFGLDDHTAYALRLCIEELAGNVLLHAGAAALHISLEAPPLTLLIEDDGPRFDPSALAEPSLPVSLDDARPGGLGLLLTRRYARAMAYERDGGSNRVTVSL